MKLLLFVTLVSTAYLVSCIKTTKVGEESALRSASIEIGDLDPKAIDPKAINIVKLMMTTDSATNKIPAELVVTRKAGAAEFNWDAEINQKIKSLRFSEGETVTAGLEISKSATEVLAASVKNSKRCDFAKKKLAASKPNLLQIKLCLDPKNPDNSQTIQTQGQANVKIDVCVDGQVCKGEMGARILNIEQQDNKPIVFNLAVHNNSQATIQCSAEFNLGKSFISMLSGKLNPIKPGHSLIAVGPRDDTEAGVLRDLNDAVKIAQEREGANVVYSLKFVDCVDVATKKIPATKLKQIEGLAKDLVSLINK